MRLKTIIFCLAALFVANLLNAQADPDPIRFSHVNRDMEAMRQLYLKMYVPASDHDEDWVEPGNCNPGKLPAATLKARLTEINYFRKMAGLHAVTLDPDLNLKAQAAAYLMYKNDALSHNPPKDWKCYSKLGAEGAGSCNLGYGGGIFGYITDFGENNEDCGHRMYILKGRAKTFGYGGTSHTDAICVFGANTDYDSLPEFVAWPPAGFIPQEVLSDRWTFSIPGLYVNYNDATVKVSVDGKALPLKYARPTTYGDGGLAFEIANFDDLKADLLGKKIKVEVEKVKIGLTTVGHTYTVVPFSASEESPTISTVAWGLETNGKSTGYYPDDHDPSISNQREAAEANADNDEAATVDEVAFADQEINSLAVLQSATEFPALAVSAIQKKVAADLVFNSQVAQLARQIAKLRMEKNPEAAKLEAWAAGRMKVMLAKKAGLSEQQALAATAPKIIVLELKKLVLLSKNESFGELANEFASDYSKNPALRTFLSRYKRARQCGFGFVVKKIMREGKAYAGLYATLVIAPAKLGV